MSTAKIERVFGRGRVKMATGDHVEVFREAAAPGERRRYTKRFLARGDADFRQWTHREWRILARLIGHGVRCVPDVVQYHGDAEGGVRQLQTYDAGVTVDQWATILPVLRSGMVHRHVFEDCAHWWALAHHSLAALDEIHALHVVHLDFKADNICIPLEPSTFDHESVDDRLRVEFGRLALIDFAFSLVSRESLTTPLPIGWEKDYDYQSPRLLCALEAGRAGDLALTQELDWRCDLYSLAAMLRRYLCDERDLAGGERGGWTAKRRAAARSLIYRLRGCHDSEFVQQRPHHDLMELTAEHVRAPDLVQSLAEGWKLARDSGVAPAAAWITPMTRVVAVPMSPTRLTAVRVPSTAQPSPATFTLGSVGTTAPVPATFTATLESTDGIQATPTFTARTIAESSESAYPTDASNAIPAVIRRPRSHWGSGAYRSREPNRASTNQHRSKRRKAWIATSAASIAAASAIAFVTGPEVPLVEALRAGIAQLRSGLADQQGSDDRQQTAVATAGAQRETEPAAGTAIAAAEKRDPAERMPARRETDPVDADARSEQDTNSTDPEPLAAAEPKSVEVGATNAAGERPESHAPDESLATRTSTVAESASAPKPPQSPAALARTSPATRRSVNETMTKTQSPRSTPSTAVTRSRVTPNMNVAQARSRVALSNANSGASRGSAFPYDPVAARSATAYLTMRATRLESISAASAAPPQLEAQGGQILASLTPTSAVGNGTIVDPIGPNHAAAVGGATRNSPSSAVTAAPNETVAEPRQPSPAVDQASPKARGSAQHNNWRDGVANVLKILGIRTQRPASIDERSVLPERLANAPGTLIDAPNRAPVSNERKTEPARVPAPERPAAPGVASPLPNQSAALSERAVAASREPVTAPAAGLSDRPAERVALPAQNAAPAVTAESRSVGLARVDGDLGVRAKRMLADVVPRVAAQARSDASQLLIMASAADHPLQQRRLIEMAYVPWRSEQAYPPSSVDDARARHYFHQAARQAFSSGRTVDALDLELRAFAAEPRDSETAGFLAALYLEVTPAQAETARQLALHALAFSGSRRSVRFEDWNTFAVASAITGRDADAARAFLVQLALSGDAERTCRAALRAYSTFGERLRGPVEALMQRIRSGPDPWACAASTAGMIARSP